MPAGTASAPRERVRTMNVDVDVTKKLERGLLYPLRNALTQHSLDCRVKNRTTLELWPLKPRTDDIGDQDLLEVSSALSCLLSVGQQEEDELPLGLEHWRQLRFAGGKLLRMLESELGVSILPRHEVFRRIILQLRGHSDLVSKAFVALVEIFSEPDKVEKRFLQEQQKTAHMLVDWADADYGCQLLPGRRNPSKNLALKSLATVLLNGRKSSSKVCVGRRQDLSQTVRDICSREGYRVDFRGGSVVNRLLQLAADQVRGRSSSDGVIILVTGASAGPSTKQLLHTLLDLMLSQGGGWKVELWSWRICCSPIYQALAQDPNYTAVLKIRYLDPFRDLLSTTEGSRKDGDRTVEDSEKEDDEADDDDVDLCTWCLTEPAVWAFLPCNHLALCHDCLSLEDPRQLIARSPLCFVCRTPCVELRHA
mmetsp:Transcript_28853/g.61411  ORF Transcript_28853/g.61411 Transcript_28853/m.61411 type:complete len:423 (-) Transcript_28853:2-1270(-)